jgi:signal peptidase II
VKDLLRENSRAACVLLVLAVFLFDQLTKWLVARTLLIGETVHVVPGLFNLTHWRNRGVAFGLFADMQSPHATSFVIGFSVVAMAVVGFLLWRGPATPVAAAGLALILGGAFGNLVDRLRGGSVVDFLDFYIGSYHWPAFNIADGAIVLGAAALAFEILRRRPSGEN